MFRGVFVFFWWWRVVCLFRAFEFLCLFFLFAVWLLVFLVCFGSCRFFFLCCVQFFVSLLDWMVVCFALICVVVCSWCCVGFVFFVCVFVWVVWFVALVCCVLGWLSVVALCDSVVLCIGLSCCVGGLVVLVAFVLRCCVCVGLVVGFLGLLLFFFFGWVVVLCGWYFGSILGFGGLGLFYGSFWCGRLFGFFLFRWMLCWVVFFCFLALVVWSVVGLSVCFVCFFVGVVGVRLFFLFFFCLGLVEVLGSLAVVVARGFLFVCLAFWVGRFGAWLVVVCVCACVVFCFGVWCLVVVGALFCLYVGELLLLRWVWFVWLFCS